MPESLPIGRVVPLSREAVNEIAATLLLEFIELLNEMYCTECGARLSYPDEWPELLGRECSNHKRVNDLINKTKERLGV